MACSKEKAILLHALLDGQIDPVNAVQFENHLRTCDLCNAEYARLKDMRAAVRAAGIAHKAPESLRLRIERALDQEMASAPVASAPLAPRFRRRSSRASWWISGLSMAVAAGLALFVALPQTGRVPLEDQIVDNHVRSLLASHLTDVESSDRHTVRPWFSGKVDVAPPAVDLADSGFPLVGGRLDYLEGHVVAALVYKRNGHTINVFASPATDAGDAPPRATSERGFNLCHWRQGGIDFWAVTDASRPELEDFQKLYAAASANG
jgi:anti-sigma factor RsiW